MPRRSALAVLVAALVAPIAAGCGGGGDDQDGDKPPPIGGNYVGQVKGTNAFVAIAAAPPQKGDDRRNVTVFVCDGRKLCEWSSGTVSGDAFTAASQDRDAEAKGKLSKTAATGTIKLPGGRTVSYKAGTATAAAGLYELKVSKDGKFSGASAQGVALKGDSSLPKPGNGTIELADGEKLEFEATRASGKLGAIKDGEVSLIVLPDGKLVGAAKSDGSGSGFYLRSSSN